MYISGKIMKKKDKKFELSVKKENSDYIKFDGSAKSLNNSFQRILKRHFWLNMSG